MACFSLFFPSGFVFVDKAISPRTGFFVGSAPLRNRRLREDGVRAGGFRIRGFMDRQALERQQKEALQATKEIVVKFIEVQRISPTNFAEMFPAIYKVVLSSVRESARQLEAAAQEGDK